MGEGLLPRHIAEEAIVAQTAIQKGSNQRQNPSQFQTFKMNTTYFLNNLTMPYIIW